MPDFKKRSVPFWTWFLWMGIILSLIAYIVKSTNDVWPELFWMAILGAVAIASASIYVTAHSREIIASVRGKALNAKYAMVAALIINVIMHGGAGRQVGIAQHSRTEQQESEDRRQSQLNQDSANRVREAEANARVSEAEAKKAGAEERRYWAQIQRYNQTGVRPSDAKPKATQKPDEKPSSEIPATPKLENDKGKPVASIQSPLSPAQTANWWFPFAFGGFILELLVAAGSSYVVYRERIADRNGNGIPDLIEALYQMNPELVKQRHPEFYAILSGEGIQPIQSTPKQSPAMSPARAESDHSPGK